MRNIHWIGTGLSSTFGIDELVDNPKESLHLWMRQPQKALPRWKEASHVRIHEFHLEKLSAQLGQGDIVVSMLPYTMHVTLAQLAMDRGAHFICSSYLSPGLQALDSLAKSKGLVVAAEMGLDPGIDHMLTHELVRQYQQDEWGNDCSLSLLSLCGGIPAQPVPFCYQFSWSPVGILRALNQPSTWLENGETRTAAAPYHALETISIKGENFQYYPNRDSLAFIDYYQLPRENLKSCLRGSIRPEGWGNAWSDIFLQLPHLSEEGLQLLSQNLYETHAYKEGQRDRVIMYISLNVNGLKTYSASLDVTGNAHHHAMTTLVCLPLLTVLEGILAGEYPSGVLRPQASPYELARWLKTLSAHQIPVCFETREGGAR